jgi:MHS family proline/betaine transporter-like MFS transporter
MRELTSSTRGRIVLASIIGNMLEWYEFTLYLHFLPIFASIFFPSSSAANSLTRELLTFAVGFLSRPLGALFFGSLGDRFGRRFALVITIVMMSGPTFLIGLMPTYAQIGIFAPLLLALLRFIQGIPIGGEFSGCMCYLEEISPPKERAYMGSWAFFGSQIGSILSTLEVLFLKAHLPPEDYMSWGWRISFILGGFLGVFGWYLRRSLPETPYFKSLKTEQKLVHTPVRESTRHFSALATGFFLSALPVSGWYLIFVFTPLYFSEILGTNFENSLILNVLLLIFCNICLPFAGKLADKLPLKPILISTALGVALLSYPLYFLGSHLSVSNFLLLQILTITLLIFHFALLPKLLSSLFFTSIRYTSIGISYNFSNIIFGGAAPLFALSLIQITGNLAAPGFLLMASALITLTTLFFTKQLKTA